jgi:hypothetical protein
MGYSWRTHGDGTVDAVECDQFVEVVYEDDDVLVIHVARSIAADPQLQNALVDTIDRESHRQGAELAIATLASEFGLEVRPDGEDSQYALTLAPRDRQQTGG